MAHTPRARTSALIIAALAWLLAACGDLSAALPPRPSPFPTLARLPSVTPVTPSPTPPPTATALAATPSPTPRALLARVARPANVRAGPGVDFSIVGVADANSSVSLQGQADGWYQVVTADGTAGWMSAQVLEVDPATAEAVPTVAP